ncbi:DUF4867 family protein [Breznakiella homolactica]|uniref:DUF4867 family protein n=1 Tax=Breznakiella homolactica TaxID=2798577 RepID=A0A7T7XNJ2_9SPIR|nr:DUF4867 family protein [Breznakiella homolactica]QQO09508.1 DUF4867 family protein [Breznakiella homolactica]
MVNESVTINYSVPAALAAANPGTAILPLDDPAFAAYGRILDGLRAEELLELADRTTSVNPEGNVYVPGVPEFEALACVRNFVPVFGGMPVQVGYCNGPNRTMNGLEYHKTPELCAAVTESVLFLCPYTALRNFDTCDTSAASVFYIPRGAVFVLDPLVLHLSPCAARREGFKMIIVLPRGTNLPLEDGISAAASPEGDPESRLLFKFNKWMIAHPERTQLTSQGVHPGLLGENRCINPAGLD